MFAVCLVVLKRYQSCAIAFDDEQLHTRSMRLFTVQNHDQTALLLVTTTNKICTHNTQLRALVQGHSTVHTMQIVLHV
jgi:hypothetical protein